MPKYFHESSQTLLYGENADCPIYLSLQLKNPLSHLQVFENYASGAERPGHHDQELNNLILSGSGKGVKNWCCYSQIYL